MNATPAVMTTTESRRSVEDRLHVLERAVRRARGLLQEYPAATALDAMRAAWETFLSQEPVPAYALQRMWSACDRAERVVEEFDTALADLVRIEAELEGLAASAPPPAAPTREALRAAEAWDTEARSAAADLARLSDPLTEARRVRPVLVSVVALMVQGAAWADRRRRQAEMSAAIVAIQRRLAELREATLAADREVSARVKRGEGLVGHILPTPAFAWPANPPRLRDVRLREPSGESAARR